MSIPAPVEPVISAVSLRKNFGDVVAVDDVSFSVGRGKVLGLLGPNGAGKTTLVKMLTTLTSIDSGTAMIGGHDVARSPHEVRRIIGLAGQAAAVDEKLSARENLELFARLYKVPKTIRRERIPALIERFDLGEFASRPASTYSGGQRRRLDIVAALVSDPLALFLDEPTTGLDPRSRATVWDSVRTLTAEGTAIVLTTQYLEEADNLADEILVVDRGCTVASGTSSALKKRVGRDVLEIHLGSESDMATARLLIGSADGATFDGVARRIDVPITEGTSQSLDLLSRFQEDGVTITDFQLRRPTLDDAFLALTRSRPIEREGKKS